MKLAWLALALWTACAGTNGQAQQPALAEHPGTIVFVDEAAGTEEARPAAEVPESVAWAELEGERVPVVRVVRKQAGQRVELVHYGPGGQVVQRTVGHSPAPADPARAQLLVGSGLAIDGDRSEQAVRDALSVAEPALEACFAASAPGRQAGRVQATVVLSVTATGQVDDAAVEVDVDDPALRQCLAEALGDVALGAGDGPAEITAPLLVKVE